MTRSLCLLFLVLLLVGCSSRKLESPVTSDKNTFPSRELTFEGKIYRYRLYIPSGADQQGKPACMLYLHGSDERGTDNEGQLSGPAPSILAHPGYFSFIIVFPQAPQGRFWDAEMIRIANAELDQTVQEFNGDTSRLYLAGFSLGGYGVWSAAAMDPSRFAALVPMSGRLLPRPTERKSVTPEVLSLVDSPNPFAAFANVLKDEPIWIFHGSNDNIVPVSNSREMAKALKAAGNTNFTFTELPNTGHISLTAAFGDAQLFEWLAAQRRP